MRDFEGSTLWRISEHARMRDGTAATLHNEGPSLLPTTLLSELRQLQAADSADDVLEVMAACLRHRESVLLYVEFGSLVWPLTLFPRQFLYHSPCNVARLSTAPELATLKLISAEPPAVRPPGDAQLERAAPADKYRPLGPLLWLVALEGPRRALLKEISGHAAYRLAPGLGEKRPVPPGALGPAVLRLHSDAASLRDIASWPGLSIERASRLLNALYLTESLMVTRSHPAARSEPLRWRSLFGRSR